MVSYISLSQVLYFFKKNTTVKVVKTIDAFFLINVSIVLIQFIDIMYLFDSLNPYGSRSWVSMAFAHGPYGPCSLVSMALALGSLWLPAT